MKELEPTLLVVDDFYDDPMRYREEALSMRAEPAKSNYGFNGFTATLSAPRKRALMKRIETLMGFPIQYELGKLGDYKFLTKSQFSKKRTAVHFDLCEWSGVLNLTPKFLEPQHTVFWSHKELGLDGVHDLRRTAQRCAELGCRVADILATVERDSLRPRAWVETHRVAHAFNRLILFRGNMFHSSSQGFGRRRADSKLSQTVFFNRKDSIIAKHAKPGR